MSEILSEPARTALRIEPGEPVLGVVGHVPGEQRFHLHDLQRLPVHTLGPTEVVCMSGRHIESASGYCGVALLDILALTGLPELPRPVLKQCLIVAQGADGYRALFSWTELYNTATGDGVLVVYEKNGRPLDAHSGPLALMSSSDRRLGPRHLRRLREIQVMRLPA